MVSTSGSMLLEEDAIEILVSRIFPLATLVTPNRMETENWPDLQTPQSRSKHCGNLAARTF